MPASERSEGGEVSREEAAWSRKVHVEAVEVLTDLGAHVMPEISSRGAVQEDERRRFWARGAYLICVIRNDAFPRQIRPSLELISRGQP